MILKSILVLGFLKIFFLQILFCVFSYSVLLTSMMCILYFGEYCQILNIHNNDISLNGLRKLLVN